MQAISSLTPRMRQNKPATCKQRSQKSRTKKKNDYDALNFSYDELQKDCMQCHEVNLQLYEQCFYQQQQIEILAQQNALSQLCCEFLRNGYVFRKSDRNAMDIFKSTLQGRCISSGEPSTITALS